MSAWIVTNHHIDALVHAATRRASLTGVLCYRFQGENHHCLDPDAVGRVLLAECVKSVAYRYSDDTDETLPGSDARPHRYRYRPPTELPIVTLLKAIDCYEYQSCEHPGWRKSEAFALCQALRDRLVHELPGYDDAPWGIDDELREELSVSRRHRTRPLKAA